MERREGLERDIVKLWEDNKGSNAMPPIRPYHIRSWDISTLRDLLSSTEISHVAVQPKFDGTHVQVSGHGIFKHSGGPADEFQIEGILHAVEEPRNRAVIEYAINQRDYVFEIELFGSKYTPMGLHRDHFLEWDLVVFEVGVREENGYRWGKPFEVLYNEDLRDIFKPERREFEWEGYRIIEGVTLKGKHAPTYLIGSDAILRGPDDLLDRLLGSFGKGYEGVVIKWAPPESGTAPWSREHYKNGLFIGKYKWPELREGMKGGAEGQKEKGESRKPLVLEELRNELADEVKKVLAEYAAKGRKIERSDLGDVVRTVYGRVEEAHPELFKGLGKDEMKEIRKYISRKLMEEISLS